MKIEEININRIEIDKNQPREEFKDIGQLASSILKEGLLEPIKVRKKGEGFIIVDGERRFKALQLLNRSSGGYEDIVRCIVIKTKDVFFTQLSFDLHKRKLNVFEEAKAFKKLLEDGWEIGDLKSRLGISGSLITRRIKLLGLDKRTKEMIKEGTIPQSVVSEIDFKSFKGAESKILSRIGSEVGFSNTNRLRGKIKRIIKEELEKKDAILNHLLIDLENFSKLLISYNHKLSSFKLEKPEVEEFINEPIKYALKINNDLLDKVQKLLTMKNKTINVKKHLEDLKIKYGEKVEITKEMFK